MAENIIKPFRSFRNKGKKADVYIITQEQLAEAEKLKKEDDFIVIDDRRSADPNMQVRDSYKIATKPEQAEVINILLDYDKAHPTQPKWNRTFGSLLEEWDLHNLAYKIHYKRSRTADVDFNNADEGKGLFFFMRK